RQHTRSKRDWSSDVCSSDLQKPLFYGRPSSVTSSMVHKPLLTSSFHHPNRNGTSTPLSCCYCLTVTKAKDQTTLRHAQRGSCNWLQNRTCAWCSPPTVPTTSICCVNMPPRHHVGHRSCLAPNSLSAFRQPPLRAKPPPRVASCRVYPTTPLPAQPKRSCWYPVACTTTWWTGARNWSKKTMWLSYASSSSTRCPLKKSPPNWPSTPTPRSPGFKTNQAT